MGDDLSLKFDIPRKLIETEMLTKFQRERLRIEGEKPNFKLLEFSNSWIGIVLSIELRQMSIERS